MSHKQLLQLPLNCFDKGSFAADDPERGISSSPVWQLAIKGDFNEEIARKALQGLVQKYPVLVARVIALDNKPLLKAKRLAYQVDPNPDLSKISRFVDLSEMSDTAFEGYKQAIFNHHIGVGSDCPVLFTWARRGPKEGIFFLQQQHAIADARAFLGLIRDLCSFYDRVTEGDPLENITPVPRMPEDIVAEKRPWRRFFYRLSGFMLSAGQIFRYIFRPVSQLTGNVGNDYTGNNKVLHHVIDDGLLEQLSALKAKTGYSVNDFLSTALALSWERWSRDSGEPIKRFNFCIPADIRPRNWELASFANHLAAYLVYVDMRKIDSSLAMIQSIHQQMRHQAKKQIPLKKALADIAITRMSSLEAMRKLIYSTTTAAINYGFSNLVPISPQENNGTFVSRHWEIERIRIMTPCPYLQGAGTTLIRYAGKLCFNFNHKESMVPTSKIEQLIALYDEALKEVIAAVEKS